MIRSNRQNRYYWKCIIEEISQYTGYHKYEAHDIMKEMFIPHTSKELTKEEFNNYCEEIRIWASQELGLILMTPNEYK